MNFQERKIATGEEMINGEKDTQRPFLTSDRFTFQSSLRGKVGSIEMKFLEKKRNIYSRYTR